MFSKTIVQSSRFLRMPATSRLLYYDLGMHADDDGYCEWYPVLQMSGAKEQDMEVLQANKLVTVFDTEVLLIKDWKENNQIRSDRYTPSRFLEKYSTEPLQLGIPLGNQMETQVRLGKVRLGKDNAPAKAGAPELFKWNEYLEEMFESDRADLNVIALYFQEKKLKFDTREEAGVAIKRHLRAAREVAKFGDDKIVKAVKRTKEEYPSVWTIETILKILTR